MFKRVDWKVGGNFFAGSLHIKGLRDASSLVKKVGGAARVKHTIVSWTIIISDIFKKVCTYCCITDALFLAIAPPLPVNKKWNEQVMRCTVSYQQLQQHLKLEAIMVVFS